MKNALIPFILAVTVLFVVAGPADAQQSVQAVYSQAVKDYNAQNYEAAKTGFEAVLKARPGYVYARNYLAKTLAAMKSGTQPVGDTLETKIAAINVPKFSFENASLGTVLTYLTQKSTELSGSKVTANFIYKGPAEDREKKLITLSLANVPMTEVIRYIGLQAGVRFTYDKYAVVGTPVGQAQKEEAAAAQAAQKQTSEQASRKSLLEEREDREKAAANPFP